MTDWYYHLPGQGRIGPLAADDVREAYRSGRIRRDTLAWRAGAREWQPLDRFSEDLSLDGLAVEPPPAPEMLPPAPPVSGFEPTGFEPRDRGPSERTAFEPASNASPYAPPRAVLGEVDAGYRPAAAGEVVYAGFWKRFAALMIDALVVTVAYYVVIFVGILAMGISAAAAMQGGGGANAGAIGAVLAIVYLAYPVISGLYYIGFESSSTQATLGKMAVGIKVTDARGERLGRSHALGRWAAHLLCYVTFYIGYLMAAFTDRKRGLHDMAAGTLVVDRWAYTAHPDRQQRGLGVVALVVLILGGLAMVAYVGILMAIAIPAYQDYVSRAAGVG